MKYKSYKLVLVLLTINLLLTNCDKNESQFEPIVTQKSETGYVVRDGYLVFDSKESFIKTLDMVANITDDERRKWEIKIGFLSQQRIVANLIKEEIKKDSVNRIKYANTDLSTVDKSEQHSDLYYKTLSTGVIKLINEGTPDEYWDYSAFNRGFTSITNEEGLFAIGDSIFQVTDKEMKSMNISNEQNKKSILVALNKNEKNKVYHTSPIKRSYGLSPGLIESAWVANSRWPSQSQRIKIGIELTCLYFTPYTAQFDFKHNFYIYCQKTNLFNSWIYYGAPVTISGSWVIGVYYYTQTYANSFTYNSPGAGNTSGCVNPETGLLQPFGTTFSVMPDAANQSFTWEFQRDCQPVFEKYNWSVTRTDANLTASLQL